MGATEKYQVFIAMIPNNEYTLERLIKKIFPYKDTNRIGKSMNLSSLRFDNPHSSWAAALEIAKKHLAGNGMTYEHRYNAMMEKRLLAILLLAAERDGREDFAYIQEMAQRLDDNPAAFAATLRHPETPEANLALEQVLRSIGTLFCEPTKQLLLSLKNPPFKSYE